jgi:hypothetical protein
VSTRGFCSHHVAPSSTDVRTKPVVRWNTSAGELKAKWRVVVVVVVAVAVVVAVMAAGTSAAVAVANNECVLLRCAPPGGDSFANSSSAELDDEEEEEEGSKEIIEPWQMAAVSMGLRHGALQVSPPSSLRVSTRA